MVQKETWVHIIDNTNVNWVKTFHLYKGFFRKWTAGGFFIKGSARLVEPPRQEYKGFKYKFSIKGDICRVWLARTCYKQRTRAGHNISFPENTGFLIKKKSDPKSKFINGPSLKLLKRKKFTTLFRKVI